MASDEYVALLGQGPAALNTWRQDHPDSKVDLRGANLRKADLRAANLRGADLREADLRSADLRGADLQGADLRGAKLLDAKLDSAERERAERERAKRQKPERESERNLHDRGQEGSRGDAYRRRNEEAHWRARREAQEAGSIRYNLNRRDVELARGALDRIARELQQRGESAKPHRVGPAVPQAGDGNARVIMPAAIHASPRAIAEPAAPDSDAVVAAVFCPPRVATSSAFLIQVFLYLPGAEHEVAVQANQADAGAEPRGTYSFPLDMPRGTRVDVRLEMPNLIVAEPDSVLVWRGRTIANQFEVVVPAGVADVSAIGHVRFAVDGVPIGTFRFKVELEPAGKMATATELCEVEAVRYRRAFVSYSSKDRGEVLRRVQAFPHCWFVSLSGLARP